LLPEAGHLGYKMNMVTNKIKRNQKLQKRTGLVIYNLTKEEYENKLEKGMETSINL
jgi:RNA binding exosome subunit